MREISNTRNENLSNSVVKSIEPRRMALFIGTYLPFSETFIYDQLIHQNKFKTLVLAYGKGGSSGEFPYSDKITLLPIENRFYIHFGWSPRFSLALKKFNPSLIHAHFGPNGAFAVPFARKLKIPLVVSFHGHDAAGLMGKNRYSPRYCIYNLVAKRMFEYTSLFLAASEELVKFLIEDCHVPPEKVALHRLGVDLVKFKYVERPERKPSIMMVGRFVEKKGFEYGLEAFARVRSRHPGIKMTITGSGPLLEKYKSIIQREKIQDSVRFTGVLSSEQIIRLMAESDIIMAPSVVAKNGDRESGIIVLKEAGASGLPAIGTIHGGIPEIIDNGKTGFLVPERDSGALAVNMEKLITNYSLRQSMGINARKKMEMEYDTKLQNEKLENHLAGVLQ